MLRMRRCVNCNFVWALRENMRTDLLLAAHAGLPPSELSVVKSPGFDAYSARALKAGIPQNGDIASGTYVKFKRAAEPANGDSQRSDHVEGSNSTTRNLLCHLRR